MTTAIDRTAFELAIAEHPGSDVHRLAYADWLDEQARPAKKRCLNGSRQFTEHLWSDDGLVCLACGLNRYSDLACDQRLAVALRQIIQSPDDDEPRLRYASILDDYQRNHYRASLIRNQITRPEHVPGRALDYAGQPFNFASVTDNARNFDQEVQRRGERGWPIVLVMRGFVDRISCTLADWFAHGQAICREHPLQPHVGMCTDREPANRWRRIGWSWSGTEDYPDLLPREVWNLLDGDQPDLPGETNWKWYPTRDAALLALGRAMIAWGRSR